MAIPRDRIIVSELNTAYVAGFMDGEGCVRIDKSFPTKRSTHYKLQVIIGNTDLKPLSKIQEKYGGRVDTRRHGKATLSYWTIYGDPATKFLEDIRPYAITKAEQIDVALEFQRTKIRFIPAPGRKISQEELNKRSWFYERIKELKIIKPVTTTKGYLTEIMV